MNDIGVRTLGYNSGPLASSWCDFVKKITLAELSKLQFVHLVKWE